MIEGEIHTILMVETLLCMRSGRSNQREREREREARMRNTSPHVTPPPPAPPPPPTNIHHTPTQSQNSNYQPLHHIQIMNRTTRPQPYQQPPSFGMNTKIPPFNPPFQQPPLQNFVPPNQPPYTTTQINTTIPPFTHTPPNPYHNHFQYQNTHPILIKSNT